MRVIVEGIATEYNDEGSGPVILMLHGWKDDMRTFNPLVAELGAGYRIVRLDLPGFGGSELPPRAWRLDDYVDIVAAFVQKLNLDVAVVVGHSFGGRIAMKGIARDTLAPKKLVLIASSGVAKRNTLRINALKALAKVGKLATLPLPRRIRNSLRERLYKNIRSDYANAGALRETFKNILAEDLSKAAGRIQTPTLLIWGSADTETPLEEGLRLSELIRGSIFTLVQAAGHFVHRDHPKEVAAAIEKFLI